MFRMFWCFVKIGLFTFGGGYAMLPLLQDEIVKKHRWASDEDLMNYFSIGQCTPGIIAINVATFIGYRHYGVFGAIAATTGIVLPSLLIIMLIAGFLQRYMHLEYLEQAFAGIRIGVTALIANILYDMWKKGIQDLWGWGIFAAAVFLLLAFDFSAVAIVVLAALSGLAIKLWPRKEAKK